MTTNSCIEQQYLKRVISEYSLQTNNTEGLNGFTCNSNVNAFMPEKSRFIGVFRSSGVLSTFYF